VDRVAAATRWLTKSAKPHYSAANVACVLGLTIAESADNLVVAEGADLGRIA